MRSSSMRCSRSAASCSTSARSFGRHDRSGHSDAAKLVCHAERPRHQMIKGSRNTVLAGHSGALLCYDEGQSSVSLSLRRRLHHGTRSFHTWPRPFPSSLAPGSVRARPRARRCVPAPTRATPPASPPLAPTGRTGKLSRTSYAGIRSKRRSGLCMCRSERSDSVVGAQPPATDETPEAPQCPAPRGCPCRGAIRADARCGAGRHRPRPSCPCSTTARISKY